MFLFVLCCYIASNFQFCLQVKTSVATGMKVGDRVMEALTIMGKRYLSVGTHPLPSLFIRQQQDANPTHDPSVIYSRKTRRNPSTLISATRVTAASSTRRSTMSMFLNMSRSVNIFLYIYNRSTDCLLLFFHLWNVINFHVSLQISFIVLCGRLQLRGS